MIDIKSALRNASTRLAESSPTPQLDAEILLLYIIKKNRAFLYAHSEQVLEPQSHQNFEALILKRLEGIPIAYLTNEREFWSLPLYVTSDTLIPRPETELLVELALSYLGKRSSCSVLELGTGTGAISLALATEKPHWNIIAADLSQPALHVAQENAKRHHVKNITWVESDWFQSISEQSFDLIISNPPYLAEQDPHQHEGDLRFEPKQALVSGEDGLDDLKHIIQQSRHYLTPNGLLLLEHGYNQGQAITDAFSCENYHNIQCLQDTAGLDRVSAGWS
ncbi:MAG: peptide chain release factor N(5)-glutamine methyltransferase [Legionellaceae bacterium]|nr:peptide chain release factor N(5)-glutamine methyltransferase [Legionellaceae bacterium]